MSKVYVDKVIPEHISRYVKTRKCDLCGTEANGSAWGGESFYYINETEIRVEVRQKKGLSYPEGGHGIQYEIDLCPACFKERLIPWLRSQGAIIDEEEWDTY